MWSPLVRGHLFDHLLLSIFHSLVTHITHYKSCWTFCVGRYTSQLLSSPAIVKACIINPRRDRCSTIWIVTSSFLHWTINTPYLTEIWTHSSRGKTVISPQLYHQATTAGFCTELQLGCSNKVNTENCLKSTETDRQTDRQRQTETDRPKYLWSTILWFLEL